MDDNQTIIQSIRNNEIPLRRISSLEDIDTLDNKEHLKNNSYLLLSFNDGDTKSNYKQKISSLLNDINDNIHTIISNHDNINNENVNTLLNNLRNELTQLINSKPHLSRADVQGLIESKHYLNETDVVNLLNQLDQLTVDDVLELIRLKISANNTSLQNSIDSDLNNLRNELTQLINSKPHLSRADVQGLINAYPHLTQDDVLNIINQQDTLTEEFVRRLIANNNVSINNRISEVIQSVNDLQDYINENYYNKRETDAIYTETNRAFNESIDVLRNYLTTALQIFTTANYLSKDEFIELFGNYQNVNDLKIAELENTINKISSEIISNDNGISDNSRIDKLEAFMEEIKENGYTPQPPMPETTVTESYNTYFWLVNESNLTSNLNSIIPKSISSVTGGCSMIMNKKYYPLQLIISKFNLDSSLDKINEPLYIILPENYIQYEGDNIKINNHYLKSNTLDLSVLKKKKKIYNLQTVKTITTVYNYENNRTEITTENINITYKCLKVVNSIEPGLALIYN